MHFVGYVNIVIHRIQLFYTYAKVDFFFKIVTFFRA